jgi:hypothetical protein
MFAGLTSRQLNQVNTATRNNEINIASPSFEVSRTVLANFPICRTLIIELFVGLTSPQLNWVNIATGNIEINPAAPSFEVSQTLLANSPICGTVIV